MALTPEQFERLKELHAQRIGVMNTSIKPEKKGFLESYFERTKEAFGQGVGKIKSAFQESQAGRNPLETGAELGAGAIETAFSPLTAGLEPIIKPTLGKGIEYVSDKTSDSPTVQKFAMGKGGEIAERGAELTGNLSTIAGAATMQKLPSATANAASNVAGKVRGGVGSVERSVKPVGDFSKNVVRDVIPTADRAVESATSKALRLAPSDVAKIEAKTGNRVGRWLADNDLIRDNAPQTQKAVQDFFSQNYRQVRGEIGKVKTTYKPSQIKGYTDALKAIQRVVNEVPGLEKVVAEVDNLLRKVDDITLTDVQRVKELVDDHFKLYDVRGDVGNNAARQGMDNIRRELQSFIEREVKNNTGADIRGMNNNVSTAKSLDIAISQREPKGLLASNLRMGDIPAMGVGFSVAGPAGAVGGLLLKKLFESPAVMLRFAKYLDRFTDVRKAQMLRELESGKIPTELQSIIKQKGTSPGKTTTESQKLSK